MRTTRWPGNLFMRCTPTGPARFGRELFAAAWCDSAMDNSPESPPSKVCPRGLSVKFSMTTTGDFGSGRTGIFCVAKSELNACMDGRQSSVDYVVYGRHDGLPALECSHGYSTSELARSGGKLWFTTVRGVGVVEPG